MTAAPQTVRAPSPAYPTAPPTANPLSSLGRFLPVALLAALTVAVLLAYRLPAVDLARFAAYLGLGIVLPGTLLWRALRGGPGLLVTDVVGGSAIGYALETLTYLGARVVGVPLLVLAWPAATLLAFAALPRLRRHWRGSGRRVPVAWTWSVCGLLAFLVLWSAVAFFRQHGLGWADSRNPNMDLTFHLAMVGELRHHLPATIPYVYGEPLRYHWFTYAEVAATSWVTGIEPQTLLYRLSVLPFLALFVLGVADTARDLAGRWWAGPLAAALTCLAVAPHPYGWALRSLPVEGNLIDNLWLSPTQAFGAMLAVPTLLLLIDLSRRPPTAGRWVLLGILLAALTGAKATFLPLLLAGQLLMLAGRWRAGGQPRRSALTAVAMVGVALIAAQLVLFRGTSAGLAVEPLAIIRNAGVSDTTDLANSPVGVAAVATAVLLCLLCWITMFGGVAGLLVHRRLLTDPTVVCCLGIALAGVGAFLTFAQGSASQVYFLSGARPALAFLVVIGLAALLPARIAAATERGANGVPPNQPGVVGAVGRGDSGRLGPDRVGVVGAVGRRDSGGPHLPAARGATKVGAVAPGAILPRAVLLGAVLLGAASAWWLATTGGTTVPTRVDPGALGWVLLRPYAILFSLAAVLLVVTWLVARSRRLPPLALALAVLYLAGTMVPTAATRFAAPFEAAARSGWRTPDLARGASGQARTLMPLGATAAGRWLREHSDPDDLVATNGHCSPLRPARCESRHFWVSAQTERRVLVEGWSYTTTGHRLAAETGEWYIFVPYWDPQRLADNDRAFRQPSPASIAKLRDGYGVRWLLADRRVGPIGASLDRYAVRRFTAGDCLVYELP